MQENEKISFKQTQNINQQNQKLKQRKSGHNDDPLITVL